MNHYLVLIVTIVSFAAYSQKTMAEVLELREQHLSRLTDTANHVLKLEEIEKFQGLDYFDFNPSFQVNASFEKNKGKKFEMVTSTDRRPIYRRFGYVEFKINDTLCKLEVYQNMALKKNKEYKDYLFIPLRDQTSGKSSYGGGRYLDIRIPDGNSVILDFNLLYNPYCAYSYRYSCPIPPKTNTLKIGLIAGEKTPMGH